MYPFAAVGLENGCVQLISFYNEAKPTTLTKIYLTEHPLSTTRFYEQGYIFVTGNRDLGEFFILKVSIDLTVFKVKLKTPCRVYQELKLR